MEDETKIRNFRLKFRKPSLKLILEKLKKLVQLPNRFCGVCSLREGAAVVIVIVQLFSIAMLTLCLLGLLKFPKKLDGMWKSKLEKDFKPYFGKDDTYVEWFMPVWKIVLWTLVGISVSYILTGFAGLIGLINKKSHPAWGIPWLIYTLLLLLTITAVGLALIAFVKIFAGNREVIITPDVVPVTGIFVLLCFWAYGFFIVLAHCKRQSLLKRLARERAAKAKRDRLTKRKQKIVETVKVGVEKGTD